MEHMSLGSYIDGSSSVNHVNDSLVIPNNRQVQSDGLSVFEVAMIKR